MTQQDSQTTDAQTASAPSPEWTRHFFADLRVRMLAKEGKAFTPNYSKPPQDAERNLEMARRALYQARLALVVIAEHGRFQAGERAPADAARVLKLDMGGAARAMAVVADPVTTAPLGDLSQVFTTAEAIRDFQEWRRTISSLDGLGTLRAAATAARAIRDLPTDIQRFRQQIEERRKAAQAVEQAERADLLAFLGVGA